MAQMSTDNKKFSIYLGNSSQLTNCVFGSAAMCHMTRQVSDFIPGSLEYTDKYIEVAHRHHITAKKKGQVQIKHFDNNRDTFITTFYKAFIAPDLCNRIFSIITLMHLGHTILSQKGFCTEYFGEGEKNAVTLTHIAQRKKAFLGEIIKCLSRRK